MRGKRLDLTGQTFGWLYLIERAPRGKSYDARYYARCFHPKLDPECGPCGKIVVVYALALKSKKEATKSCGNHGLAGAPPTHGCAKPRTVNYYTWVGAIGRCFNKDHKRYDDWGGRGITMCDGYRYNFPQFDKDLGPRPEGKILDRIDNDGHYSCGKCPQCVKNGWPMNIHWATRKESQDNRRISKPR